VDRESVFQTLSYTQEHQKKAGLSKQWIVLLLVLGVIPVGMAIAYLIATGNWVISFLLVFALPVFLVLLRFPFSTVIIWLVLSPFLVQTPSTAERMVYWIIHRLLPVATLGIMIVSSALRVSHRRLPRFGLTEYAMLGYVVITVISIFFQNNSISGTMILFYDRVFIPMCLYWIVKLSSPGENTLKWLIPVAFYIVLTQIAIGSVSWIAPSVLPTSWTKYAGERTTGSLNSVSVFTTTITFAGAFLLYAALKMKHGLKRNILILLYVATLYGVFISFSRASWLAGLIVFLGIFTMYPKFMSRLSLWLALVTVLIGGTLLVGQFEFAEQRFLSDESQQTALSRLPVMIAAYRMFEQKPIIGWGYGNFDRYDRQFQGRFMDMVNPDEKDLTSHNMYLTLLAEQGIVGFVLLLAPVFLLFFQTMRVHSRLTSDGLKSKKMIYMLWLVVLSFIIVKNFAPIVVVFGLGLYWVTLGLISNTIRAYSPVR